MNIPNNPKHLQWYPIDTHEIPWDTIKVQVRRPPTPSVVSGLEGNFRVGAKGIRDGRLDDECVLWNVHQ
jgi:hypothetical protein